MISALEIRLIICGLLVLGFAGSYFKGRLDEKAAITQKQLADNAASMQRYADIERERAAADDLSRQKTASFMAAVEQGITNVNSKFSKLPSVVLDARGCERLSPSAGMRWNAVELLPAGPADQRAEGASGAVPASQLPPAGGLRDP